MPAAALFIAVDGSPEHLVGMHAGSKEAIRQGILGEIFPQAATIASDVAQSGFTPNVEAVLALQPDVVLQWATSDDLISPLENAGLKVIGLNYGAQQDLESWITLMGQLVGKPERAAQMIDWQHQVKAEIEGVMASVPAGERPRILYFNRFSEGLRVAGEGTYNDFYIAMVGGVHAAAGLSGFADINDEQLLAWDPEFILIGNFDDATPEDVYARPLWQDVSAVKNRRVYKVPLGGYRWDPPNQESPLMWRWLATLIQPERFDFDLRADIKEAYRFLYDYELSEAQIDVILQQDLNREAALYERFAALGTQGQ